MITTGELQHGMTKPVGAAVSSFARRADATMGTCGDRVGHGEASDKWAASDGFKDELERGDKDELERGD
ncbi:MAG: hypothetical protein N2C14_25855, partial [Planctomycetales bacterium]